MHTAYKSKRFAIIVLGAGFSVPAGLPTADELWREVRRRALSLDWYKERFQNDIQSFIEFKGAVDGVKLLPSDINFEEFLGFLDMEFHLGLRGSDTWSRHGNETQCIVKALIAQVIVERTPPSEALPELYLRFVRTLKPGDHVLTFNYDLVLERSLERAGIPYRLFRDRYKVVHEGGGAFVDDSKEEVVVLKLHGSVDWFDRSSFLESCRQWRAQGLAELPNDPIFNSNLGFTTRPLVDGPRFKSDPLREVHRLAEVERRYNDFPFLSVTPLLINPSTEKALFARQFEDFWYGLGDAGVLHFRFVIVGFSLPQHDRYARQVVFSMVRNYQTQYWGKKVIEKKKEPLLLIDRRMDAAAIQQFMDTYAFVDPKRASFYLKGFDQVSVKLLDSTVAQIRTKRASTAHRTARRTKRAKSLSKCRKQ